ncbi:MAG: hypothetical protein Q8N17_05440 [Burkholderiaceae bacterium]|nr:hypothetical protein [Burkholderiaceae bacterium]
MNQPTPAIVAQSAVRRLPRLALLLLCLAYVLPGFIGRGPWKNADVAAFGFMAELATGRSAWLAPSMLGQSPEVDGLLPYWLGAWAMKLAPAWIAPDLAARIPFILLLGVTLAATWHGVYYLARSPRAQPVSFAFGGEAHPTDYARAMADGGLLALIACLGLAQLSHETTPALTQICFTALSFYAVASLRWRTVMPAICLPVGLFGLSLSGAAAMASLFGAGSLLLCLLAPPNTAQTAHGGMRRWVWPITLTTLGAAVLAWYLGLWHWRIDLAQGGLRDVRSLGRLLLWFTWPALPLALWTLWRWRRQLLSLHVALPLWFAAVALGTTMATPATDRSLLLGLPALATLAAFALPTLSRSVAALIDWFTLLFFTGCAIVIWVVWIAMQTGMPPQPAANVARQAPGFEPTFSLIAFLIALAATLAWAWLVHWRVGRHRAAIWKSLVLPAGGAALSWMLLMTLWLPLLDYARSYAPMVRNLSSQMDAPGCIQTHGLAQAQIAALKFHGRLDLAPAGPVAHCPWLVVDATAQATLAQSVDMSQWRQYAVASRPTDRNESLLLFKRR